MNTEVLFSSKSELWSTPQDLFDELNKEFHFNLDPCATSENAKCAEFFTKEQDGLQKNWGGTTCFAIPHMAEQLGNGYKRHTRKAKSRKRLLYALFLPERIQDGFTIMCSVKRRSVL